MHEAGLAEAVTRISGRCTDESIVWTLARLKQITGDLEVRRFDLAIVSPREVVRPTRLLDAVRVLADLIREPGRVEEVRHEDIGPILMVTSALEAALAARLAAIDGGSVNSTPDPLPDRLLTAHEAAGILGVSADYLYRHARTLPFAVRPTPGSLRFSSQGIGRYMRQKRIKVR